MRSVGGQRYASSMNIESVLVATMHLLTGDVLQCGYVFLSHLPNGGVLLRRLDGSTVAIPVPQSSHLVTRKVS